MNAMDFVQAMQSRPLTLTLFVFGGADAKNIDTGQLLRCTPLADLKQADIFKSSAHDKVIGAVLADEIVIVHGPPKPVHVSGIGKAASHTMLVPIEPYGLVDMHLFKE